jgi:hypothetical protein
MSRKFDHICTVMVVRMWPEFILPVNYLSDCFTSLTRFTSLLKNGRMGILSGYIDWTLRSLNFTVTFLSCDKIPYSLRAIVAE